MGYKGMKYWRPSSVNKLIRYIIEDVILKVPVFPHYRFLLKKIYYKYGWCKQVEHAWQYYPLKDQIDYKHFKLDNWYEYINPEFYKLYYSD